MRAESRCKVALFLAALTGALLVALYPSNGGPTAHAQSFPGHLVGNLGGPRRPQPRCHNGTRRRPSPPGSAGIQSPAWTSPLARGTGRPQPTGPSFLGGGHAPQRFRDGTGAGHPHLLGGRRGRGSVPVHAGDARLHKTRFHLLRCRRWRAEWKATSSPDEDSGSLPGWTVSDTGSTRPGDSTSAFTQLTGGDNFQARVNGVQQLITLISDRPPVFEPGHVPTNFSIPASNINAENVVAHSRGAGSGVKGDRPLGAPRWAYGRSWVR